MKKLFAVLLAALMLLTVPQLGSLARAVAEETQEPSNDGTVTLALEDLDPSTLHVHKLGEVDGDESATDPFADIDLDLPYSPDDLVRVSIFLDGESTVGHGFATRGIANNKDAQQYRESLRRNQDSMQSKIEDTVGHELNVKWNLTLLTNAISVEIPYKDIALIRRIPGVKSVEFETQYEAPRDVADAHPNTANTSEQMVGAQAAWTAGYTGAGSRIAIIDTGIDTTHQSFADAGFDKAIAEFTGVQLMNSIPSGLNGSGKSFGKKIPYGYNYVDKNTTITHTNDTQGEHGSHVAGIAAANRYIGTEDAASKVGAVGMAPDAQLCIMKVFGANGGAYDSDYMVAIEDAIVLECDSCNLSLGSAVQGWTFDNEYQDILNSLSDPEHNPDMVVAISAGNSYSLVDMMSDSSRSNGLYIEDVNMHTGGSPGTFINSLCVAAAQNTLTKGTPLTFNGSQKVFYYESTGNEEEGTTYTNPAMTTIGSTNGTTYSYVYIDATGSASDYSTVNGSTSLSGKIVIVNRGDLSFVEKGENAKSYNPKAVVIANNQDGTIYMDLSEFTGTFPMVTITQKDAIGIKANATAHTVGDITYYTGSVTVTTTEETVTIDRSAAEITDFSSWGVPGSLIMKPEITAPGGDIYSVYGTNKTTSGSTTGGSDKYEYMSGTSMAAPHITGLAAVAAQYMRENGGLVDPSYARTNPYLAERATTRAILQSLLMSTATPMKNDGNYLSILQQGAGLADVNLAINASSVVMMDPEDSGLTGLTGAAADGKVKFEFGDDPKKGGEYSYTFEIYNITGEALAFTLETELFTQAIKTASDGRHMAKTTTPIDAEAEYQFRLVSSAHDVDRDGDTDEDDVLAILDYLTGERAASDCDLQAADLNGDNAVTSYDAHVLLQFLDASENTVPAHGMATVTVSLRIDADALADYPCGAYVEGFTYIKCGSATREGVSLSHTHSIPILGFYGNWTDPSMFDAASYTDGLYQPNGTAKTSYTGNQTTNYLRLTQNGSTFNFSGNPYTVEDEFPTDRLAINSNAEMTSFAYNLYRAATATGFAVTKTDEIDGNNTQVLSSTLVGSDVDGIYYSNSAGWQNLTKRIYGVNKTPAALGLAENDTFRIGFYAIPEYTAMVLNDKYNAAASLNLSGFNTLLTDNALGKGAFVGYSFTVDDTEPEISNATLSGNTLSITASDNKNLAYVAVMSLDGSVIYAENAPGSDTYTVSFDASDAIANAHGYVAVFAGDYAGNEAAMAVKVNDNAYEEKTVYVLTNKLTAGNDYLIVSRNSTGSGVALGHSGTTIATNAVTVKAGIAETDNAVYIDSADVASTSIWTASSGIKLKNGNYYLRRDSNKGTTLQANTTDSYNTWTWSETNNRLSMTISNRTYYLRYNNNAFSLNTSTSSIYLYKKTVIRTEIDPTHVMSVSVTPQTLDLYKGNTTSLTAKVLPLTAEDRTVTWSSSNTSVATVDENGHVTAVAAGNATITATANGDSTKSASCSVSVTSVNKSLNGIIWDEEGNVYFSSFNASNLPTWTKLHNTATGVYLMNAFMADSSTLYASTCDISDTSVLYTVNRTSYALTEFGTNYVPAFGMARASSRYTDYMVYGFTKYLIFGNLTPQEDDDGTFSGIPYGLIDLATTDVGDSYVCGVCARSIGTTSSSYYFLDESGKIWQTTMTIGSSVSFGTPSLVVDTGIGTSFQYQNLYFDGTYLYWSHCDGEVAELIIINPLTKAVYHAGNFGEGVWPAAGLYVNGSVAPASVGDSQEIMGEEELGELQVLVTRDELLTEEIRARFAAELAKMNRKGAASDAIVEPVEPEAPIEDPAPDASAGHSRARIGTGLSIHNSTDGTPSVTNGHGTINLSESKATTNGLFTIDASKLDNVTAEGDTTYISIHQTGEGQFKVAYAAKDEIPAKEPIATITYDMPSTTVTVVVDTYERSDETFTPEAPSSPEEEEIPIPAATAMPAFKTVSITMSGDLGLNFFVEFPEGIDPSGSYMTFTVGTTGQDRDEFDAADFKTSAGVNRYRFTCHVNALQMADTVTATLYYTVDGQEFTVNKEYSVKKYISYFEPYFNGEATSPYDDATLKMVKSIADYGHYAQPFLFTFHNVPSGTYALMPGYTDSYDLNAIREAVSGYGIERSIENTDIESVSFALSMESETSIILRLTMKSGAAAPTLTVNGTTLNPGDAGVKLGNQEYVLNAYGTTSEGKARYEIRIKNISAHRLSDVFSVNGDANGAFEIKAVALYYVKYILSTDASNPYLNDTDAQNCVAALYTYCEAVKGYIAAGH